MNRLIVIATLILFGLTVENNASAQSKKAGSLHGVAMNGNSKAALSEQQPDKVPHGAKMITFPVKGEKPGNAVFVPADQPSDRILLIFPDKWGLNHYMQGEAETWHAMLNGKVNVYVVDLYDGQVASDDAAADRLSEGMNEKRGEALINGVLAAAGPKIKHVSTLGSGFGGGWAVSAAAAAGNKAEACVLYYGLPEKDMNAAKRLKCDVLFIRALQDNQIKESDLDEFAGMVKTTGNKIDIRKYDAVHAFAYPDFPKFDDVAAYDAQRHAEGFLKHKLMID